MNDMAPFQKARDEAAEAHAARDFDQNDLKNEESAADYVCCKEDFKAGADFGFAFAVESPEVRGLKEALERIADIKRFSHDVREDIAVQFATEALAAFEAQGRAE